MEAIVAAKSDREEEMEWQQQWSCQKKVVLTKTP
jgi:hypothetical protein